MKMKLLAVFTFFAGLFLTGCMSIDSTLNRLDSDVSSLLKKKQWDRALDFMMNNPQSMTTREELVAVFSWRKKKKKQILRAISTEIQLLKNAGLWHQAELLTDYDLKHYDSIPPKSEQWGNDEKQVLKNSFIAFLLNDVVEKADEKYQAGDIDGGDAIGTAMWNKYLYGDNGNSETVVSNKLKPCLDFVQERLQIHRSCALIEARLKELLRQLDEVDLNGKRQSLAKLNSINAEVAAYITQLNELFTEANNANIKSNQYEMSKYWSGLARASDSKHIKTVKNLINEFAHKSRPKLWYVRVQVRIEEYADIQRLVNAGNIKEAYQQLSRLTPLLCPKDLAGSSSFNDQAEREKLLNGPLGMMTVKKLFEAGVEGVQYKRLTPDGKLYSLLVVGCAEIDGYENTRELQKAQRIAMSNARSSFLMSMKMNASIKTQTSQRLVNDEASIDAESQSTFSVEATTQDLTLVAKGLDKENNRVVIIMGWRTPEAGTLNLAPLTKDSDNSDFLVSPSVGAFL